MKLSMNIRGNHWTSRTATGKQGMPLEINERNGEHRNYDTNQRNSKNIKGSQSKGSNLLPSLPPQKTYSSLIPGGGKQAILPLHVQARPWTSLLGIPC